MSVVPNNINSPKFNCNVRNSVATEILRLTPQSGVVSPLESKRIDGRSTPKYHFAVPTAKPLAEAANKQSDRFS